MPSRRNEIRKLEGGRGRLAVSREGNSEIPLLAFVSSQAAPGQAAKKIKTTKKTLLEGARLSKPAGPKPFSFVSMKEEGEEAAFLPPTQDSGKLAITRAALRKVPAGLQ